MKKRRRQCTQICLLSGGILLVSLGIVIFIYLEFIYEFIIRDALKFTPTSETYKAWITNEPPLDIDLYLFNWTNPEDIRNPNIKPHFEEIGPYRTKEVKEKTNVTWNNNDTISYMVRKRYFYYHKDNVRNVDEDKVTTINPVPLTVAYQTKDAFFLRKKLVSVSLLSISQLSVTKTAREILFDGYEDSILSLLSNFPGLNVQEKFGLFYGKNGTIGKERFTMHTAVDEKFGRLLTWDDKTQTDFYSGHCNDIKGSANEFYPLNRKKDKIVLYSSELCKYAELEFTEEVVLKGVRGYKYIADYIFDNGTTRPENKCFCNEDCVPSGVLDVSVCRQNSPTFLSFPHFYAADPYYTSAIEGMKPDKNKHGFWIILEPKSGIIMEISASMQLNMMLQPINGLSLYQDVQKILVPMFYFAQKLDLKDDLAANLRLIQGVPEYLRYASVIFAILGAVLIVWGACSIFNVCSPKKGSFHIQHEEVPLNHKEKIARP